MSEFDWLDQPAQQPFIDPDAELLELQDDQELAWLFDDPAAKLPAGIVRARNRDPQFKSLAAHTRALPYRQKLFLKFMLANSMMPARARKKMEAAGVKTDHHTTARWMQDLAFKAVLDKYANLALASSGAAHPASTILRINEVVEDALIPVHKYHQGEPLRNPVTGEYEKEVDRGNALKGLEMLGKTQGIMKPDDDGSRNRVTVILDFSGDVKQGEQASEKDELPALEGDFEEVLK